MALISVIVPVYGVEKYLQKCIESIIAQTYSSIEIILVDDGSPDNSGKICDEYAKKDSRIKVIHQPNGGLSAARNAGLDIATGEYVSFVDSDDYIDDNYLSCMMKHISNGDMVSCSVVDENETGTIINVRKTEDRCYSTIEALNEMCYEQKLGTSACGKLLKKELVDKNRFPIGKLYEDLFTAYKWYLDSKTVISTSDTFYHYVHHFGSISNNDWNDKTTDLMEAANNLLDYCSLNCSRCYLAAVYRYFFSANDFLTKAEKSKDYKRIFSPYRKKLSLLWKELDKGNLSFRDYIKFKLMIVSPALHRTTLIIYNRICRK